MANNSVNAVASNIGTMQINENAPANFIPNFLAPGAVQPYDLPLGDVEEPFDPISVYAIMESGRYGPLDEGNLKTFLRHKLDRRIICSKDVVQRYTDNVAGLSYQLTNLRNRINQIQASEKERTDYLKKRIRDFEKALKERKALPNYRPHELNLSIEAKEAFRHIGSQGPLTEVELINFIHTGVYNSQIPLKEIITQLKDLRLRINDNVDIAKHKVKLPYARVLKALDDMLTEMMTM